MKSIKDCPCCGGIHRVADDATHCTCLCGFEAMTVEIAVEQLANAVAAPKKEDYDFTVPGEREAFQLAKLRYLKCDPTITDE